MQVHGVCIALSTYRQRVLFQLLQQLHILLLLALSSRSLIAALLL